MYLASEHLTTSRIVHHTPSYNYIRDAAIEKCARFFFPFREIDARRRILTLRIHEKKKKRMYST